MKTPIALILATTVLLAGCKDDEAKEASTEGTVAESCTPEELMTKSQELSTKLQANPEKAPAVVEKMTELAPKLQAATTGGEVDPAVLSELCTAYTAMLAEF